jgi:phage-related protein
VAVLQLVFKGQDEVAGASRQVADDLRGVGHAADEAKSAGTGFFGGLLQTAGGFLAANVIGGITAQVGSFVSNAFADARETQQLMGQTQAVITSTGGAAGVSAQQVADLASSLSDAAGKSLFGHDQIQAGENLLLTFTNIKETLPDATKIMVDMAQAMGTDVKGGAIQLGKALNDPINGISALSRVGVTFTDEQKAQIKAMQDSGNMAGAQRVILAELNKEFGGSAEAAAKATGGWSEFQGRLGEAGETMATAVLPILGELGSLLLDNLMPVIEQAASVFGTLIAAFQTGAEDGGDAIDGLSNAFYSLDSISPIFDQIGDAVVVFGDLLDGVLAVSGDSVSGYGAIWDALAPAIEGIITALASVLSAVFGQVQAFLHAHGDDIRSFLQSTWIQISEIIKIAIQLIQATIIPALQAVAGFIGAHGAEIQRLLSDAWTIIKAVIDTALTVIKGVLTAALQIIKGDWGGAWDTIKEMFAHVWENIKTIVSAAADGVKTELSLAWDAIKGRVQDAWDGIKGTIASAWDTIKSSVSDKVSELVGLITDLPGKVVGVGAAIVQTIWDGIKGKWDQLVHWFSDQLQRLRDQLPFSEPKDTSSPLYGLGRSGEAIVTMIQQGIGRAAPLAVGAPMIGTSRGGSFGQASAFGGVSAGAEGGAGIIQNFYFEQAAPRMTEAELIDLIQRANAESGRVADVQIRSGVF